MRRTLRLLLGGLAAVALLGSLVLTSLRFVEIDQRAALALTSFSAYAVLGYAAVLILCLLLVRGAVRRAVPLAAAGVSLLLLALHLVWLAPWLSGDDAGSSRLTVASSNLEVGQGDPDAVLRLAAKADVLVLQEVTPDALAALDQAGLGDRLPYRAGTAVGGVRGTMVFSRYRLSDQQPLPLGNGGLTVRVAAPKPFRLYAVHTAMLLSAPQVWHDDLVRLRARLTVDAARGPVLAAGDWNATYSHLPMRRVLDAGVRDASEASSSWRPTWPTQWRESWLRPVVAIDHVLMSKEFLATATRTVNVHRTDHLALVAQLSY